MKNRANRRAVVVSAALTFLILTGVGGAALAANRLFASRERSLSLPFDEQLTSQNVSGSAAIPSNNNDALVAAYQARLQEAYQALDQAYAQIDALQTTQAQPSFDDDRFEQEHEGQSRRNGVLVLRDEEFSDD